MLIVLAVVGTLAKSQLRAVDGRLADRNADAASQATAAVADVGRPTVVEQSKNMQDKARDDTVRALQQGMERNDNAER